MCVMYDHEVYVCVCVSVCVVCIGCVSLCPGVWCVE